MGNSNAVLAIDLFVTIMNMTIFFFGNRISLPEQYKTNNYKHFTMQRNLFKDVISLKVLFGKWGWVCSQRNLGQDSN